MPSENFPLELVTPAFIAGANPRAGQNAIKHEGIRVSGVIAGLRWWVRALAGGILGSEQLPRIRAAESLIFGSTAASSRLRLSITPPVGGWRMAQFTPQWDKSFAYFAHGMRSTKDGREPARWYLAPGNPFSLTVQISPPRSREEPNVAPELIRALMNVWIGFGGIGGRTRRSLGGLQLRNTTAPGCDNLDGMIAGELAEASARIREFLASIAQLLQCVPEKPANENGALPGFPIVGPDALSVKVSNRVYSNPTNALRAMSGLWRKYRLREPNNQKSGSKNRDLFHDYLFQNHNQPNSPLPIQFAGLGLPIPFQFRHQEDITGTAKPSGKIGRRASPIWFRVRRVRASYAVVALYWRCVYLPEGTDGKLSGSTQNWPVRIDSNDAERCFDAAFPPSPGPDGWKSVDISVLAASHRAER